MSGLSERENRTSDVLWRWTKFAALKSFWGVGVVAFGGMAFAAFWMAFALVDADLVMIADGISDAPSPLLVRAAMCAVGVVFVALMGHCAGWYHEEKE